MYKATIELNSLTGRLRFIARCMSLPFAFYIALQMQSGFATGCMLFNKISPEYWKHINNQNVFSVIVALGLLIAWSWERVGGFIVLGGVLGYILSYYESLKYIEIFSPNLTWLLFMTFYPILAAALFIICGQRAAKSK
jgi:hypothetical protein